MPTSGVTLRRLYPIVRNGWQADIALDGLYAEGQMSGSHDTIIAQTAKAALAPLGFRRKGRSRTWLADHGWWLTVIEFQPSAWSKGSYLNVATHWLWSDMGSLSFDFGGRVTEFVEYVSDAQFAPAIARLAENASHEAQRLAQMYSSLSGTARVLLHEARTSPAQTPGHPGWMAYHAGVAAGLVGRAEDAGEMFGLILSSAASAGSVLHSATERMAQLASAPMELRREVISLIERQRDALRLRPLEASPF